MTETDAAPAVPDAAPPVVTQAPAGGAVERWAPLVAGAAIAAPTLIAHYPPMSDLPLHEAVVGLMRHYGDAAYFPPELYSLNLGHANQLFHVLAWALSYLVGTVWAVKLVIAAAQFLIFWMGARFADHLGRSRWGVLLLAPLALGYTYYWGLVANLLGFAALLGVLPAIDNAAANPSRRRAAAVCGLLVLVFFAHEAVFVAGIGLVAILALAYPLDRRKTAVRLVPVVFAVLFTAAHYVYQARFFTRGQVTPPMTFTPLWDKIYSIPNVLFGSHDMPAQLMLLGLSVTAALALAAGRVKAHREAAALHEQVDKATAPETRFVRLRAALLYYRFEITAVGFLFFFFVMPFTWKGATLVHERFFGPAWALLVICAAPRAAPRIAKLAAAVLPVAILLLSWPQFADSDATSRNLDTVIEAIPLNSSVALVAADRPIFRTRVYSAAVGPARTVATRGGRMALSLVISPLSAVQIRTEYRWDEFDIRTLLYGSRALMPSHDLVRFGWIIAQSREPEVRDLIIEAMKPEGEHVLTQGEWMLFRSTLPQVSMLSPADPPPPRTRTILQRMNQISRSRTGTPLPPEPKTE
ncbi:MAG TPA: hypothetical protein VLT33_32610 [Labilithrix sp.]|nr:hypothetical protein [Labilithrix sp.]